MVINMVINIILLKYKFGHDISSAQKPPAVYQTLWQAAHSFLDPGLDDPLLR